jgi:hypothetical protein
LGFFVLHHSWLLAALATLHFVFYMLKNFSWLTSATWIFAYLIMANFRPRGLYGDSVADWVLATPCPPPPDGYASYLISNTLLTMDLEDPWNWDVDRIVRELCTEQRTWKVTAASRRMPDPVKFEEALRAQEIDGATLLTEVTEDVLEHRLGVRVFGQLAAVKQVIRDLRQLSSQYETWVNTFGSDISLATHHVLTGPNIKKRPQSLTPGSVKREDDDGEGGTLDRRGGWIADTTGQKRRRLEDITSDLISNTPAVLEPTGISQDHVISHSETIMAIEDDRAEQVADTGATMQVAEPAVGDTSLGEVKPPEKKVKRIAPTLITATIDKDRDRKIPTQADMVINNEPHDVQPGVIYKGQDGKKRLMLVSQSDNDFKLPQPHQWQLRNETEREEDPLQLGRQRGLEAAHRILRVPDNKGDGEHADNLSDGYLGKKKHAVDEIFYPGIPIGKELPSIDVEDAFWQVTHGVSSGRRLYIHGLMKHYLRSKRQIVHRNGKQFFAHIPYAARLAPMHHVPSFTLMQANNGSFSATRENLLKWPEVEPSLTTKTDKFLSVDDARRAQFDLPDNLPLGGPSSYDNWDPDVLEKYRYIDGGDVVLPLYGESDEEGEYDVETWNEIEEERGILEMPLLAVKKRQLTDDEVNAAIDEGIAQILVRWNRDKLPKRQGRAWSLWRKSRRHGTKRRLIQEAQQHVDRINNERLPQMRNKILEEIWTSQNRVRWQSKIMEQSIFDREDLLWQISTLKSTVQPEKPLLPVAKLHKQKRINDGEDGENIETTDVENSYDELDDFIVDDDGDILSGEGDNLRADDEAEESTVDFPKSDDASSDDCGHTDKRKAKLNSAIGNASSKEFFAALTFLRV